jgi:hypothetical protein
VIPVKKAISGSAQAVAGKWKTPLFALEVQEHSINLAAPLTSQTGEKSHE